MDYPDCAGAASGQEITGLCIYNEYNTSGAYQQLVYKREWKAFLAIRDDLTALRGIFSGNEVSATREILLNAKGVCLAEISVESEKQDFILIPLPKRTENILYLSEKHQPITTIKDAYRRWDEKIKGNLQYHYGTEWNKKLEEAIRMEGKDVSKGNNE